MFIETLYLTLILFKHLCTNLLQIKHRIIIFMELLLEYIIIIKVYQLKVPKKHLFY
jgi:hypothetical protein